MNVSGSRVTGRLLSFSCSQREAWLGAGPQQVPMALLAEGPQSGLALRTAPRARPPPQRNQIGSAGIS